MAKKKTKKNEKSIPKEQNQKGFKKKFLIFGLIIAIFAWCFSSHIDEKYFKFQNSKGYKIVKKYYRNLSDLHYTQGLKFLSPDVLIESGGLYKRSEIHYMNLTTMDIFHRRINAEQYFGEGCALIINENNQEEIHQLTWRERKIFVYNNELEQIKTFNLPKEMKYGWGLASHYDKQKQSYYLLATDGTNQIFFINPSNWEIINIFKVIFQIFFYCQIKDQQGQPILYLNDLDIINNRIFINVYMTTYILELDLATGKFLRSFNFQDEKKEIFDNFPQLHLDEQHCLNGIAYDKVNKRILITGKQWPIIYEVEFNKK